MQNIDDAAIVSVQISSLPEKSDKQVELTLEAEKLLQQYQAGEQAAIDLFRLGPGRGQIGTGIRLGHADAETAFTGGNTWQEGFALFLGSGGQDDVAGLTVSDPVPCHGRARGQQFFHHHVAFQEGAFMAAIFFRPCHADPALVAQLLAEFRADAHPVPGPVYGAPVFRFSIQKIPDFASEILCLPRQLNRVEVEKRHALQIPLRSIDLIGAP